MKIKEVATLFIEEQTALWRAETVRYDKDQIRPILAYMDSVPIEDFDDLKKVDVLKFITFEKEKGLSSITINKHLNMLKRLILFAYENEQQETKQLTLITHIPNLKAHYTPFPTLTNEQLVKLVDYYKSLKTTDFKHFRLKVILGLLLCTGIRMTESLFIESKNINLNERVILLERTKTEKVRNAFIAEEFTPILREYMEKYPFEYLITTKEGNQLTADNMSCIFKRLSKTIGFSVSPHIIRHTFATNCIENDMDLETLRVLMGHTRLTTTQIYLNLSTKHKKAEYDKANIFSNMLSPVPAN